MHIRRYKKEDFQSVITLDCMCFQDTWNEKNWRDALSMKQYRCFLAEEENEIRGFLLVSSAADEGEILKIAVDSAHRGKAYGLELLKTAFSVWKSEGIKSVFLEVRSSNSPAICLYEKVGFKKIGIRKNYYRQSAEDAIVYACHLEK